MPFQDYPDCSMQMTWIISYYAIWVKSMTIANLLLLWACFNNKDLWYSFFVKTSMQFRVIVDYLLKWLLNVINNEVDFIAAMQFLYSYFLIKGVQDIVSYVTYLVVYKQAFYIQDKEQRVVFTWLVVIVIRWAVLNRLEKEYLGV